QRRHLRGTGGLLDRRQARLPRRLGQARAPEPVDARGRHPGDGPADGPRHGQCQRPRPQGRRSCRARAAAGRAFLPLDRGRLGGTQRPAVERTAVRSETPAIVVQLLDSGVRSGEGRRIIGVPPRISTGRSRICQGGWTLPTAIQYQRKETGENPGRRANSMGTLTTYLQEQFHRHCPTGWECTPETRLLSPQLAMILGYAPRADVVLTNREESRRLWVEFEVRAYPNNSIRR